MPIVLTARTLTGESLGACAASCYDASPDTHCQCICGGQNHGVGRLAAMGGALELAEGFSCATVHPEANQLLIPGTK